jgi:hypothetical protein
MTDTSLTSLQHQALKILVHDTSESQPITGTNLAKRLNLKQQTGAEGANLRSIIHTIRVKGFPICATGRGYFYARTNEQLSKFITRLQNRLMSQEEALSGLKEAFHNVGYNILGAKVKVDGSVSDTPITFTVRKAVRGPNGGVVFMNLKIGTDGKPIVPAGIELI